MKKICSLIVICFMFFAVGNKKMIIAQSDNLEIEQENSENENILDVLKLSIEEIEEKLLPKLELLEDYIATNKYLQWINALKKTKCDEWAKELFATIYKGQDEILEKINNMYVSKRCCLAMRYSKGEWEEVDKIIKTEENSNHPLCGPFPTFYMLSFEMDTVNHIYMPGYNTWEECYRDLINEYLYLYFEENPEMLYKVNQLSLKVRNYIVVSLNS